MVFSERAGALVAAMVTHLTMMSLALRVVTPPVVQADLGSGVLSKLRPPIVVPRVGRLPMVVLGVL